jgi:HK97 family phage major capsid protein
MGDALSARATQLETAEQQANDADAARQARLRRERPAPGGPPAPGTRSGDPPPGGPDPTTEWDRMLAGYSLQRAAIAWLDGRQLRGVEAEVNQELLRRRIAAGGRSPSGFLLPSELPVDRNQAAHGRSLVGPQEQRNITTASFPGLVQTVTRGPLIDLLRDALVLRALGVNVLTGLTGNLELVKKATTTQAYWVTEGNAPTKSGATTLPFTLAPRTVGAWTDWTRKTMMMINESVEMMMREDIAFSIAAEIDRAGIDGSGSGAEPLGLIGNPDIPVIPVGTDGGVPTLEHIVALEATVETNLKGTQASLGWLTSPRGKGRLRITPVVAGQLPNVWGQIEPSYVTTAVPTDLTKGTGTGLTAIIYGQWRDFILAFWSGVDILVDPITLGTAGGVRIVGLQDCDMGLRREESFGMILDVDPIDIGA